MLEDLKVTLVVGVAVVASWTLRVESNLTSPSTLVMVVVGMGMSALVEVGTVGTVVILLIEQINFYFI